MSKEQNMNTSQGHWILAKMGKRVLRPGGKELSMKMIEGLGISPNDDVVEFAPGLGFTAGITLGKNPKSYTGVELNEEAAGILKNRLKGKDLRIIIGTAAESTLESNSVDKVYGEAMLTMHADHRKSEIIREAYRILKSGGFYGIHELGLTPDEIPADKKANARPLTVSEWTELLEKEGFSVVKVETNPMHLLEPKRMIDDEGFFRTVKIFFNIMTNPAARKRILAMRKVFRDNAQNLNAVAIIAQKK